MKRYIILVFFAIFSVTGCSLLIPNRTETKVVSESEERVIINDYGKKFAETSLYNLDDFYMTDLEGYQPYIKKEFGVSILDDVESEILYLFYDYTSAYDRNSPTVIFINENCDQFVICFESGSDVIYAESTWNDGKWSRAILKE